MVYKLPHIPAPGETPTAPAYSMGLDGKGANQSVAAVQIFPNQPIRQAT
jgi:ribokinase